MIEWQSRRENCNSFGCYLGHNSYLHIKVVRKLSWSSELLAEHELRAKGIWKPWGIFSVGKKQGILQCLHTVFISCETWLLSILLDQCWHHHTIQFLFRIVEASVFCYHKGCLKQLTSLENFNLSLVRGYIHLILMQKCPPFPCSCGCFS